MKIGAFLVESELSESDSEIDSELEADQNLSCHFWLFLFRYS